MPVRLPGVVHVFLHDSCDLKPVSIAAQMGSANGGKVTYLDTFLLEVVFLEGFLCDANCIF